MEITVLPTKYKGYTFRSRTEARWAVFFDALGWNWQYEAEGYSLPSGWYLPDFYFPDLDIFAEVKGKNFSDIEKQKCLELSTICYDKEYNFYVTVLMLDGPPARKGYQFYQGGKGGDDYVEVILLSPKHKFYPLEYGGGWYHDLSWTDQAINKALSYKF